MMLWVTHSGAVEHPKPLEYMYAHIVNGRRRRCVQARVRRGAHGRGAPHGRRRRHQRMPRARRLAGHRQPQAGGCAQLRATALASVSGYSQKQRACTGTLTCQASPGENAHLQAPHEVVDR